MNHMPQSLNAALQTLGLTLSELLVRPGLVALVLVGSRAAGLARPDSDWDVLALVDRNTFGPTPSEWHGEVCQLMACDPSFPYWLATDLAGHALCYGLWLLGGPTWTRRDLNHEAAAQRALRQFNEATEQLAKRWDRFIPAYRSKYARRAAQQLERLRHHHNREPIPPTALLAPRPLDVRPLQQLRTVTEDFKQQLLNAFDHGDTPSRCLIPESFRTP